MRAIAFLWLLIISTNIFSQGIVQPSLKTSNANPSESYVSFAGDGAWCWFSDPRAVYYESRGYHLMGKAGVIS